MVEVETETQGIYMCFPQTHKVGDQMQVLFSPSLEECFLPCFHYCFSVAVSIQLQLFLLFFTAEHFNLINYTNNSCK